MLGFNSTWTKNFQMFKMEKAEEQENKLPTSIGSSKKQENSRKTSTSASLTMLKPLTIWITTNWKILHDMGMPDTLPVSWETCMQIKKQQSGLDIDNEWTGSKLGKEYVKAVYCNPAYLTCMQSTSCKMLDWMKHKLESRLPGEISTTSGMQIIPL